MLFLYPGIQPSSLFRPPFPILSAPLCPPYFTISYPDLSLLLFKQPNCRLSTDDFPNYSFYIYPFFFPPTPQWFSKDRAHSGSYSLLYFHYLCINQAICVIRYKLLFSIISSTIILTFGPYLLFFQFLSLFPPFLSSYTSSHLIFNNNSSCLSFSPFISLKIVTTFYFYCSYYLFSFFYF